MLACGAGSVASGIAVAPRGAGPFAAAAFSAASWAGLTAAGCGEGAACGSPKGVCAGSAGSITDDVIGCSRTCPAGFCSAAVPGNGEMAAALQKSTVLAHIGVLR